MPRFTIANQQSGETIDLPRDVCAELPTWVYEQTECNRPSELQEMLDQYDVALYYEDGKHVGADCCGIAMYRDETTTA